MTVQQLPDGQWIVASGEAVLAGPFKTNGEAWRALDVFENQALNKAQSRSDWIAEQILGRRA